MAGIIDRAALGTLGAILFYVFFLNAWDSIPLACASAFACTALCRWLLKALPFERRATASQARAELLRIAELDDSAAEEALTALILRRWPDECFRLTPVLKHPEATLSSGDVLNAWKSNRSARRLVVAATCPCEPRAALYARRLREPAVAVLDSRRLTRLLRTLPADRLPEPPRRMPGEGLRMLWAGLESARFQPRSALLAMTMLGWYILSGNAWYLLAALAIAAHAGMALIRRGNVRRLFDEG